MIYKKKLRVAFEPQMSASKTSNQNDSVLDFQKSIFQKIFNLRIERNKKKKTEKKLKIKRDHGTDHGHPWTVQDGQNFLD